MEAFLAANDLLQEQYGKARATYLDVEKSLPKGAVPFVIRFGVTFSHLYEGNVDAALESLRTYLAEYRAGGLDQQFPEVFIWNAMARINLENGRLEDAMKAYEKGYESIPGSTLDEIQKKTWLGRLHHGKARTLARMGKHEQAWAEVETIKKMIDEGGEPAKQYVPGVSLRRRVREARGRRLRQGRRAPRAGGQERPLPDAAAGPRLREAGAEGQGEGGVPEGRRLAVGGHREAAGLPRGQAEGAGPLGRPQRDPRVQPRGSSSSRRAP